MFPSQPFKYRLFPTYDGLRVERFFGDHWSLHLPFAYDLIRELAPGIYVELGVWKGESYFTFCQSVAANGVRTKCFGIDTWEGDKHMGKFPAELYQEVATYNSRYAGFSTLKRSAFDKAVHDFADGSIDLLHIDGAHGYEDVKKDFETWLPKVSERGVILFHDTMVRDNDFGVWKLWAEIAAEGRSVEFEYGHGLGVWKKTPVGPGDSAWVRNLFQSSPREWELTMRHYLMAAYLQGTWHEQKAIMERKTEVLERDRRTLAQNNDQLRRDLLRYHSQNEQLLQMVESFEQWQKSWITRVFHRWHNTPKGKKRAGFFRRLERSLRKRRKAIAAFLRGEREPASHAKKESHLEPASPSASSGESKLLPGNESSPALRMPAGMRFVDEERRRFYRQLTAQAARHPDEHVHLTIYEELKTSIKLIAYYLPQFHPIPENDLWWGKGFTEWTNVTKANAQFIGHYQPHFPGEMGFYDLRLADVQKRQIELAKNYGIFGFCYHYYWFNGRKLLETPLRQMLANPELEFPFCICWANENWTRRWDGSEHDILAEQVHTPETDQAFIREIEPILRDKRYIRIGGRPLIIVYRVDLLPEPAATVLRWKEFCIKAGIGEPLFVAAKSFEINDPRTYGFDAAVEFPPHQVHVRPINGEMDVLNDEYTGTIHDYMQVVDASKEFKWPDYKLFRTVMPSWDNEPRKPGKGRTFTFSTPGRYQEWLSTVIGQTVKNNAPDDRLVFINAWNEWAEGAHLEPDRKYGYAYLDATHRALAEAAAQEKSD